jgi:aspartyl-tRNA(Asn)/glutamyl-tRNA(Gln) amidotransferase subunit C
MADSKITEEQVRHVARLAALRLSDAEATDMCSQLGAILGYMEALSQVDTTGVTPTFHSVAVDTALRPDEVVASGDREQYLSAAPRSEAGAFAVPKVLDGGG